MADPEPELSPQNRSWKLVVLVVALAYLAFSLWFMLNMRSRLRHLEHSDETIKGSVNDLHKRLDSTQAAAETLASQLGMTRKELALRATQLQRQQRASESRLAEQQRQQITEVSGEVAGVKTEVGSVRSDVASTRTDLEATKSKLERAIGDLGVQSGLIAHTRDDLEELKHRGDRNYYEFTLDKKKRTPVSTVSLQLKKTDPKRGKFTLNVIADDRNIEKKDRNVNEPMQFYTGRDRMLYELVVWTVDRDRIKGYLSTPKNAPKPMVE